MFNKLTMMLRDDLYTLSRESDRGATFCFRATINPQHPLFAGHFPGQPILPGVCTLAILRDCVAEICGYGVRFAQIRECKFTAPVDPSRHTELECLLTIDGTTVQATVMAEDIVVLKLKANFVPKNG